MQEVNEALKACLVANMCQPNTNLAKDVLEVLGEFGIPLTKTYLGLRMVYRRSAVFGGTVHEEGSSARSAIEEVDALTDEVLGLLKATT